MTERLCKNCIWTYGETEYNSVIRCKLLRFSVYTGSVGCKYWEEDCEENRPF